MTMNAIFNNPILRFYCSPDLFRSNNLQLISPTLSFGRCLFCISGDAQIVHMGSKNIRGRPANHVFPKNGSNFGTCASFTNVCLIRKTMTCFP